jgi:K+-transporting ATPase ATPase C chain
MIFQEIRASLTIILLFTIITGLGYPFLMTNIAMVVFPYQANGSLVEKEGKIIGSELVGQSFTEDKYFHSRPSAAGDGYDAANSSGSNLSPSSPDLIKTLTQRADDLRRTDGNPAVIPVDMVTASGSGLDPDISVASANYQAMRVAQARNISQLTIHDMIMRNTTTRSLGILGENRVNVLNLNRELDAQTMAPP